MPVTFSVNQQPAQFDGPPDVPLLWVVREQLGLTGSKFGCGIGACGACTMHIDGLPARSCIVPIAAVEGRRPSRASRPTPITRCSAPGASSTCRNAGTANPA